VTIAVPCLNQGRYLDDALKSIYLQQNIPVEVFVLDGGSTDDTISVIRRWEHRLSGWRSYADNGQAAAINEGIEWGRAPFVCWLNSDDWYLPACLGTLISSLESQPAAPAVYGRAWNYNQRSGRKSSVWVEPFDEGKLAFRCIISQPATLIRRVAWEAVGGVDPSLKMAMDYDLWWRLYRHGGPLHFVDEYVAVNRDHAETKTRNFRRRHYAEAISIVRKHYGRVPLKWWLAQPYAVWFRSIFR
jgi:glycosyltransferase involved in cell wall biosynthesis